MQINGLYNCGERGAGSQAHTQSTGQNRITFCPMQQTTMLPALIKNLLPFYVLVNIVESQHDLPIFLASPSLKPGCRSLSDYLPVFRDLFSFSGNLGF